MPVFGLPAHHLVGLGQRVTKRPFDNRGRHSAQSSRNRARIAVVLVDDRLRTTASPQTRQRLSVWRDVI